MPQPNSAAYWKRRAEQNIKAADKLSNAYLRSQKALYRETYEQIGRHIDSLYLEFLKNGEISTTKMYEFGRWRNMQADIQKKISHIGIFQNKEANQVLSKVYKETLGSAASEFGKSIKWGFADKQRMQSVLSSRWSGQNFSERIWANTDHLAARVQKSIIDSVSLGRGSDELKRQIMADFGVGYNDASRLIRTEQMHVLNTSQADSYKQAGCTQYEFLSAIDSATSEACEDLNGQIFSFDEAQEGENFPPLHPNCRSTIIPVVSF